MLKISRVTRHLKKATAKLSLYKPSLRMLSVSHSYSFTGNKYKMSSSTVIDQNKGRSDKSGSGSQKTFVFPKMYMYAALGAALGYSILQKKYSVNSQC